MVYRKKIHCWLRFHPGEFSLVSIAVLVRKCNEVWSNENSKQRHGLDRQ